MTKQKLGNRMAFMSIRILLLLLTAFLLTGCAETSAEPSDESGYDETDGENETEDTKASEKAGDEEEWEETEDEIEEPISDIVNIPLHFFFTKSLSSLLQ